MILIEEDAEIKQLRGVVFRMKIKEPMTNPEKCHIEQETKRNGKKRIIDTTVSSPVPAVNSSPFSLSNQCVHSSVSSFSRKSYQWRQRQCQPGLQLLLPCDADGGGLSEMATKNLHQHKRETFCQHCLPKHSWSESSVRVENLRREALTIKVFIELNKQFIPNWKKNIF